MSDKVPSEVNPSSDLVAASSSDEEVVPFPDITDRPFLLDSDTDTDFEIQYSGSWEDGVDERRPLVGAEREGAVASLELDKRGPPDR